MGETGTVGKSVHQKGREEALWQGHCKGSKSNLQQTNLNLHQFNSVSNNQRIFKHYKSYQVYMGRTKVRINSKYRQ